MAPAPHPHDVALAGAMVNYVPQTGQEARMNTVSLSVLIEFVVHRTYHDLTVLSELLPHKSDTERKIEIYNFAARTRLLFVRLASVVKWANSVGKVEKSSNIMNFLEKQSILYVETADVMVNMARDGIARTAFPIFQIPTAVEILTTGTRSLPNCIRQILLPPDPITPDEEQTTLLRLNKVIQHRLVTSKLPPQMRNFKIHNGRVVFSVKHEFNVTLTLMSDHPHIPWRLLEIEVLIEDKEIGDGRPLVHTMQKDYMQRLLQSRLLTNEEPLCEVYNMLHFFCQSLQLELLFSQALRLKYDRLNNNIEINKYEVGVRLTVSYWCELTKRDPKNELSYRMTIETNRCEAGRPLAIIHVPSLPAKDRTDITERALLSEVVSIEHLLVHTVHIRTMSRLTDLRVELQSLLPDVDFNIQGTPAILTVPVLTPCLRAEQIHITINTHNGFFRCHVPKHLDCPIMKGMEKSLNGDRKSLLDIISELRYWITHRRCEKTLQHLPASATEFLPLVNELPNLPLLCTGRHKMFVKLHRHRDVILIVELNERKFKPNEMDYSFHLAFINFTNYDRKEHIGQTKGTPVNPMNAMLPPSLTLQQQGTASGGTANIPSTQIGHQQQQHMTTNIGGMPMMGVGNSMSTHVSQIQNVQQQQQTGQLLPLLQPNSVAGGVNPANFGIAGMESLQRKMSVANMNNNITLTYTSSAAAAAAAAAAATANYQNPKPFIEFVRLIEFDTFVATHGRGTDIDEILPHKRKAYGDVMTLTKQQKMLYPAYFIPELAHVVAMCDEKIPFLNLAQEFARHNIQHSGIHVESNATSLALQLLALPRPKSGASHTNKISKQKNKSSPLGSSAGNKEAAVGIDAIFGGVNTANLPIIEDSVWADLTKRLMSVSIRSQMNKNNQIRIWVVELVFGGTPLPSLHPKEQGERRTVYLTYEQANNDFSKTVLDFLRDWSKIVYLYTLVYRFADVYLNPCLNMRDIVSVQSYSFMNLLLGYGPKKKLSCNIYWSPQSFSFRLTFVGGISAINAHSIMREPFIVHLNSRYNLPHVVYLLHETYSPLSSIAKLQIIPQFGIPRPHVPVLSFCILTQSPCLVRLAFQAVFCLEIRFMANKLVAIRDGAYSSFDRSLINELTPIQGLKGFLNKYLDENSSHRGHTHNDDDNPPSPMTGLEDVYGGPASVSGATSTGGSSPFLSAGMRGPQSPRDSGLRFPTPHTPPSSSNPHTPASPHPVGGGSTHPNFNLTSPPGPHMPHPSPGSLMPSSPLNPQPSPHMVHSPGPNLYMQSHQDSPFAAMSPANTNWPGSPSMPRPSPRPGQSPEHKPTMSVAQSALSRANRSWAGAVPTFLAHEALDTICRPSPHPQKELMGPELSPLERFLGCVFMRRQLQRTVQNDDSLQLLNSNEPGVVIFKVDGLQCQVTLNPIHMQSLHLKVTQLTLTTDVKIPFSLTPDDLMVIEQFFDTRVAVPPYRPNSLNTFCRILNFAPQVLKDFVQLMRLDLKPELGGEQLKWTLQFCMRVPPSAPPIVPIGSPSVLMCRLKILFFLQVTRIPYNGKDWKDSPSIVLPMVYDLNTNITQLAERREPGQSHGAPAASAILRRFLEYGGQHGQCSLFPAVRDLLINLQLPNDVPPPQPQTSQVIGLPVGVPVVGVNQNTMMHSPMQQQMGGVGLGPGVYSQMGQAPGPPHGAQ